MNLLKINHIQERDPTALQVMTTAETNGATELKLPDTGPGEANQEREESEAALVIEKDPTEEMREAGERSEATQEIEEDTPEEGIEATQGRDGDILQETPGEDHGRMKGTINATAEDPVPKTEGSQKQSRL